MNNRERAAVAIICIEVLLVVYVLFFAPMVKANEQEKCYSDLQCELLFNKHLQIAKSECTSTQDVVPITNYRGYYYDCEGTVIEETE